MQDYYHLLGIPRSASSDEIKASFKKLALKYHPDKNPGNEAAEEKFKEINRAYQVLSDSYKKYQYDLKLNYKAYHSSTPYTGPSPSTGSGRKGGYSSTYTDFSPPFTKRSPGKGPKNYDYGWGWIKAQLYAFAFIFLVAIVVLGSKKLYTDYKISEAIRLAELRDKVLAEADSLYHLGKYRESLNIVLNLQRTNPIESKVSDFRQSLVTSIREEAELQYSLNKYDSAVDNFTIVKDFQRYNDLRVYHRIMECYLALEEYDKAVETIDYILSQDERNLEMYRNISMIYYDQLNDPEGALVYLDKAKSLIKQTLRSTYGHAYEIVMLPENAPPIYFDIHLLKARANIDAGNLEDAVKDLKWTIFLDETHLESYKMRADLYLQLDRKYRACKDLIAASELGDRESANQFGEICSEESS